MKLIVITSEESFSTELSILHQLFNEGLEVLHFRKPLWSFEQTDNFLSQIQDEYLSKIVLHDHYELLEKYDVLGIHYNSRNRAEWLKWKNKTIQKSASFHTLSEFNESSDDYQYIFFSPVFNSISKKGYQPTFSKEQFIKSLQNKKVQTIALGGISATNVNECQDMGFDGVAVLGAVWSSSNPLKSFKAIQQKCLENELTY